MMMDISAYRWVSIQQMHRLPKDLVGLIAKRLLGRMVKSNDASLCIHGDDHVEGAVDEVLGVIFGGLQGDHSLFTLRDVTHHTQDCRLAVELARTLSHLDGHTTACM